VLSKTGNTASISGGVLTISGGTQSHELSYSLPVVLASPIVVEFRARRLNGTTSSPAREQLGISIGTATNVGVHFFVGPDVVFLTNGTNSRGPEALVDTDAMHVYRVEVSGTSVKVFYDGAQILTGSTFSSVDFPTPGIGWGDITSVADGASEWEYFQHNSSAQTGGTLSIGDVIMYEGNAGATVLDLPVRLSGPCSAPVSIAWKTVDGTATAVNADFLPDSSSLTLLPGATSGTISVSVNGDATPENHETFLVSLLNPVNAAIVDAQGSAMILNDDTVTAAEGGLLLTLSMTIQGNPAGGVVSFRLGLPEAGKVELSIFDVAGRLVAQPIKSILGAGYHTVPWDPRRDVGSLASGVYFARFQAQDRTLRRRFVLVR
jgi:hypothetical protein